MYDTVVKARAKINITLDVLNRREDHYHNVKMIMQTVALHDRLYLKKTNKEGILLKTNLKWLCDDERNLAYKAAQVIYNNYNINKGVFIDLNKKIPIAAGLAGGSADCAAVLKGLNRLFDLNISNETLCEIGATLGADVPFCINGGTYLCEGIGEVLTPLNPMPECYVVLAKPYFSVSTPWVYSNLELDKITKRPNTDKVIDLIKEKNMDGIASEMVNVLESVTEKKHPEIAALKDFMIQQGAIGAMMSGSGPTVFGLFKDKKKAKEVVYKIKFNNIAKQAYVTKISN